MTAARPLALVTGGWKRIGAAIARRLAGAGWDLALHAHHAGSIDGPLAADLAALGAQVVPLDGDLAVAGIADALIDAVVAARGAGPDLLVNCAALFRDDTLDTLGAEALSAHFAVNFQAPVLLTRAMARALAPGRQGVAVHILDQRVANPVPDQISYTLSKQALHAAVRTLARALAPHVRVNGVAPGLTLPTGDYEPAQWQRLAGMMPLHLLARPEDLAEAVLYLAGARAVTGQTLFVDAGAHLEAYARDFVYLGK